MIKAKDSQSTEASRLPQARGQRGGGQAKGQKGPGGKGPAQIRPAGPVGPILRRLLTYMKPHALLLTGVVFAALLTSAAELAPPIIIRGSVDRLILGGETDRIVWAAGGLMLLSLVRGGIDFLRLYLNAYMGSVLSLRSATPSSNI